MFNSISSLLSSGANILWLIIVLPVIFGLIIWFFRKQFIPKAVLAILASTLNLIFAISLYFSEGFYKIFPFASNGLDIAININKLSSMYLALVAATFFVVCIYCVAYLKQKDYTGVFMLYLFISLAMINGVFISDNLGIMLFFWEGLLCTLFGFLLINNKQDPKSAIKALTLNGVADLLLMFGIIIVVYKSGTPLISHMHKLHTDGLSALGFVFMFLGAVGKSGCMPFHSWIPTAAVDAPTTFMVSFPGSLEKFLGIYLASRMVTEMFDFHHGSAMSIAVMTLGTITIIFAVAMALIQKDMKRLLSYHAVSQVGYMVLGIGTGVAVGIVGGVFHMLNNVIYKSCLFMTAGSIEKQTGTTDIKKISGLGKAMPVTMVCFVISALSISGVPPFNGFFSKELIFDAALEIHPVFYIGALLGAFCTAISFLKLGMAVFGGKQILPSGVEKVKENGIGMLLPMAIMSALCIVFGLINTIPLDIFIGHSYGIEEVFSGLPKSATMVIISVVVLALAVVDHIYGAKKTGRAAAAADHIHYAPVLKNIYDAAEKEWFDPFNWIMTLVKWFTSLCVFIERWVSWLYDDAVVALVNGAGGLLSKAQNGNLSRYLIAAIGGIAGILIIFLVILL